MIEKLLEILVQRLNALATKIFKEESYPYLPPLSRRERRKSIKPDIGLIDFVITMVRKISGR